MDGIEFVDVLTEQVGRGFAKVGAKTEVPNGRIMEVMCIEGKCYDPKYTRLRVKMTSIGESHAF